MLEVVGRKGKSDPVAEPRRFSETQGGIILDALAGQQLETGCDIEIEIMETPAGDRLVKPGHFFHKLRGAEMRTEAAVNPYLAAPGADFPEYLSHLGGADVVVGILQLLPVALQDGPRGAAEKIICCGLLLRQRFANASLDRLPPGVQISIALLGDEVKRGFCAVARFQIENFPDIEPTVAPAQFLRRDAPGGAKISLLQAVEKIVAPAAAAFVDIVGQAERPRLCAPGRQGKTETVDLLHRLL